MLGFIRKEMKRKIVLISIIIYLFSTNAYSTEQTPDILIVGQDTFYLFYTFPIEELELTIDSNPFTKKGEYEITISSCWRGYQAIWEIENNKLYLQGINSCHSDSTYDYSIVIDFFINNGYEPKIENGRIVADWFSTNLVKYDDPLYFDCDDCIEGIDKLTGTQKLYYTIINGEIKEND